MFQALRSPAGEAMVLEQNTFVEQAVPGSILRRLTDQEMAEYRRPFLEPGEGRRPTLSWPRQGKAVEFCRSWPNQKEITVGGIHYLQEDSPDAIGQAVADWLRSIA